MELVSFFFGCKKVDAVMLSGETAMGQYPVESVKYMDTIVATAGE